MSVYDGIILISTVIQAVATLIVLSLDVCRDFHGKQPNDDHKEKNH